MHNLNPQVVHGDVKGVSQFSLKDATPDIDLVQCLGKQQWTELSG